MELIGHQSYVKIQVLLKINYYPNFGLRQKKFFHLWHRPWSHKIVAARIKRCNHSFGALEYISEMSLIFGGKWGVFLHILGCKNLNNWVYEVGILVSKQGGEANRITLFW